MIKYTLPTGHALSNARPFTRTEEQRKSAFDFPTAPIGIVGKCSVYVDPRLGSPGRLIAKKVFADISKLYGDCETYFGVRGRAINVIVAPVGGAHNGDGGAYHYGCDFTTGRTLYCDVAIGNPQLTEGLVVAELTECFMGLQAKGWDCGASNGEALSRFLAELESGGATGALMAFSTGPTWDKAGRPNWIDATEPTDQDSDSTGCGVLYLYWMMSLGFTPSQITRAGCSDGTLATNYSALTGKSSAWADFSAALPAVGSIITDNPW